MQRLRTFGSAVLTAALVASPAQAEEYWTCGQRLEGEGYVGSYWQWVGPTGEASEVRVQLKDEVGLSYTWSYSNRFTSVGYDSAYFGGPLQTFDATFADGPEYVGGIKSAFDHPAPGELWAHYYGDGIHVLSEVVVSRKSNRRNYADRHSGLQHGIGHAAIAALFESRLWQISITDSNGKIVTRHTIVPIDFAAVRQQIETQAPEFEDDVGRYRDRCTYNDGEPVL